MTLSRYVPRSGGIKLLNNLENNMTTLYPISQGQQANELKRIGIIKTNLLLQLVASFIKIAMKHLTILYVFFLSPFQPLRPMVIFTCTCPFSFSMMIQLLMGSTLCIESLKGFL